MKTSLPRFVVAAVLATGCFLPLSVSAAQAEKPRAETGPFGRALMRELELSPDQRDALKGVIRLHQPMLRPLRQQAKTERAALHELIAAPTLDETALTTQADRIAATHKEIVIASARLRADLRKILTAEQLTKLEGWRAHAKARGEAGGRRARGWLLEP